MSYNMSYVSSYMSYVFYNVSSYMSYNVPSYMWSYTEDRTRRTFRVKQQHQSRCQGQHFHSLLSFFLPGRCSSLHLWESTGILLRTFRPS